MTAVVAVACSGLLASGRSAAIPRFGHAWRGGAFGGCVGEAYGWSGGGSGYKTDVWVNTNGSRVTVLLLNARHYDTSQPEADQAAHDALARLYCGA